MSYGEMSDSEKSYGKKSGHVIYRTQSLKPGEIKKIVEENNNSFLVQVFVVVTAD